MMRKGSFARVLVVEQDNEDEKVERPPVSNVVRPIVLLGSGPLHTFGCSEFGRLGQGDVADLHLPGIVAESRSNPVSVVACGFMMTYVYTVNNDLLVCGDNSDGQLGLGDRKNRATFEPLPFFKFRREEILEIAPGGWHCLFLIASRKVFSVGDNRYGQLGDEASREDCSVPGEVMAMRSKETRHIACGAHYCVAMAGCDLWSWGNNKFGQLGIGTTSNRAVPARVFMPRGKHPMQISCRLWSTFCLMTDGSVYSWGCNDYGGLGILSHEHQDTPCRVTGPLDGQRVVQLGGGCWHTFAVTEMGTVYAWGQNYFGQLGLGHTRDVQNPTWVVTLDGKKIIQVFSGFSAHSFLLSDDGQMYACGWNSNGQLGLGDVANRRSPVPIPALAGKDVVSVSYGNRFSAFVTDS